MCSDPNPPTLLTKHSMTIPTHITGADGYIAAITEASGEAAASQSRKQVLLTWGRTDRSNEMIDRSVIRVHRLDASLRGAAMSPTHTVAYGARGIVYEWANMGGGRTMVPPRELPIPQQVSFTQVSCGEHFSIAIDESGRVYSWGRASSGCLGCGFEADLVLNPALIVALREHRITKVACGATHAACISSNCTLFTWGWGLRGQLGLGPKKRSREALPTVVTDVREAADVACGAEFTLAVTTKGAVYSWGRGTTGQLGHGDLSDRFTPKLLEALQRESVTLIACGAAHALAMNDTGEMYAWGDGSLGQLGTGTRGTYSVPQLIGSVGSSGQKLHSMATDSHSVALDSLGQVYTWGVSEFGCLAQSGSIEQLLPVVVSSLQMFHVSAICCSYYATAAIATEDARLAGIEFISFERPAEHFERGLPVTESGAPTAQRVHVVRFQPLPVLADAVTRLLLEELKDGSEEALSSMQQLYELLLGRLHARQQLWSSLRKRSLNALLPFGWACREDQQGRLIFCDDAKRRILPKTVCEYVPESDRSYLSDLLGTPSPPEITEYGCIIENIAGVLAMQHFERSARDEACYFAARSDHSMS
jgi:alpha-tubulin suppressor-like RCC1 family protein